MDARNREIQRMVAGFSQVGMCLGCHRGILTVRVSRYGYFWGCSRYPKCYYKRNLTGQEMVEYKNSIRKKYDEYKQK